MDKKFSSQLSRYTNPLRKTEFSYKYYKLCHAALEYYTEYLFIYTIPTNTHIFCPHLAQSE